MDILIWCFKHQACRSLHYGNQLNQTPKHNKTLGKYYEDIKLTSGSGVSALYPVQMNRIPPQ